MLPPFGCFNALSQFRKHFCERLRELLGTPKWMWFPHAFCLRAQIVKLHGTCPHWQVEAEIGSSSFPDNSLDTVVGECCASICRTKLLENKSFFLCRASEVWNCKPVAALRSPHKPKTLHLQSARVPANLLALESCWLWMNVFYPYPYRGGGRGGQNQPVEFHFFLLGNPGIVIQPLEWNCKVTFLSKPWALVWKYLRLAKRKYDHGRAIFWRDAIPTHVLLQSDMCLAPPELSASI